MTACKSLMAAFILAGLVCAGEPAPDFHAKSMDGEKVLEWEMEKATNHSVSLSGPGYYGKAEGSF